MSTKTLFQLLGHPPKKKKYVMLLPIHGFIICDTELAKHNVAARPIQPQSVALVMEAPQEERIPQGLYVTHPPGATAMPPVSLHICCCYLAVGDRDHTHSRASAGSLADYTCQTLNPDTHPSLR